LSEATEPEVVTDQEESREEEPEFFTAPEEEATPGGEDAEIEVNAGLTKAIATYRKLYESKELSEKEQAALEERIKEIEGREIIESDTKHESVEIPVEKGKITVGPPTLTRFEKARIMGARALQLSLGAPPFIPIPEGARTSLDIAMEELEQKVIPIVIRRSLPNGDYQNIPLDYFD